MFPMMYVYAAGAILFAGMGVTIKYQSSEIKEQRIEITALENSKAVLNEEIKKQNAALRASEVAYNNAQVELTAATAKNETLAKDFAVLKNSWKTTPIPKDCPSAINELRLRNSILAKTWNKK